MERSYKLIIDNTVHKATSKHHKNGFKHTHLEVNIYPSIIRKFNGQKEECIQTPFYNVLV